MEATLLSGEHLNLTSNMNEKVNQALPYNRRDFLKSGSFATLMTMMGGIELLPEVSPAQPSDIKPVAKVKVAVIGLGNWGRVLLETLGRVEVADVAAICDTYGAF